MLLAGDEVLRTQRGNNNAYCQDNEISWFDWALLETERDMLRYTRELIALRRRHACLTANRFYAGRPYCERGIPDIAWHGIRLDEPPWRDPGSPLLAFTVGALADGEDDLHVILNMSERAADVALPTIPGRRWHLALDTSRPPPSEILAPAEQRPHAGSSFPSRPRSVVVLEARP
jgi:glycogen operon protein